ncbi:mandelate racemase/muconate lactonizing enzyme family protein [Sporomusa acidovorans]|uniref:D-galactonate dehydratase n=1 Tax=Sporomusa acidovorans (strain ATCC 49682 / DSM 3132 / Mol) TaxID=1123286 RepID=A0ABZ3J6C0_SPOA4|nr:mandelate racemase/muconate lactonizing enzyme family protein [Sporomusa acidovorans]OZC24292.1 D-galactonate dehydratase [Sporomusa acidovorans DSM 3132]SDF02818.1 L-alanine-DL-glutamate epimerase [Sporomusa acidovorans]
MKIVSVDVMQVPSGNSGASRGTWCPVIVRVNTDEGISGFGEVGLAYGKGWRAGFGMVQDFAEVIIGEDPLNIEKIWEKIFRKTFWGMGGGTVVNAGISGIDIALWDIKGKAFNLPVWQLLGGKTNDNLRTYASQLQYNWGPNLTKEALIEPEEYAEVTRVAMAEGYDAIKVDPIILSNQPDGKGSWKITGPLEKKVIKTVYDRVAAMRKAGGDDLDIIIEHHSNTDTVAAIQIGKALEDLRIFYYEEPCHPLNPTSMLEVKNNVNIPIASGERIYTRFGYREFLENRSLHVIQPDICLCGGLTEAKKICDMAYTYDCAVQIHVCGSPISKAAALQIEAVIPNFIIHEHHQRALNPESRATCLYDYQPVNGKYKVPDRPGIGQELTPEAIAKSTIVTVASAKTYG